MILRCDPLSQYKKYKKEVDQAIARVLNSGRYILSSEVERFEKEFAKYFRVKYAVGVASGTDALILSLKAIDIDSGDEVITTAFTAIPTVSAIIAVGAKPVFADIDPKTFLMDIGNTLKKITPKTKAIIPVHLFGDVVDVVTLRKRIPRKVKIIEDACQAHGSRLGKFYAGSVGDLGAFSFYPTKNLGGYGDGGMITTNSSKLAKKLYLLRQYGMTDKDHIILNSINSRLDELQAAVLRVKLKYLKSDNIIRNNLANIYIANLRKDLFEFQQKYDNVFHNYHIFAVKFKKNRKKFVKYLEKNNIQTNVYFPTPLHFQKANSNLSYAGGDLPNTEKLCSEVIALPLYPELKKKTLNCIISIANSFT